MGRLAAVLARVAGLGAILLCAQASLLAQRELHWDAITVMAHLNADGSLTIAEEQTLVFTGDWNGGERGFHIRPGQTLTFEGMSRWSGSEWLPMRESAGVHSVDDYAFTDRRTLRWRSRLPTDPPFHSTPIRYQLRYTLGRILRRDADRFTLDHDFAFPERPGRIDRFELTLTLDPVWQPLTASSGRYSAEGLAPGKSFVLNIPMHYAGTGEPMVFDGARAPAVYRAVLLIAGITLLSVVWLVASERRKGRFVEVETAGIDEAWLQQHILKYPAEIVSAAWDDSIGSAEVVTLLARMTVDGKLESIPGGSGMALRLLVDRERLPGYERALVDALFFDGRTTTTTADVKAHYKKTGLDLVGIIRPDLATAVRATLPLASTSRFSHFETWVLFLVGVGLAIAAWLTETLPGPAVFLLPVASIILTVLGSIGGWRFRKHMDRGLRAMAFALIPPLVIAAAVAAVIGADVGRLFDAQPLLLLSVVALALAAVVGGINSLGSRQQREGIAFRKRLAAGRQYFRSQLAMPQPALRDAWYPWLLAFELQREMDDWSVAHVTGRSSAIAVLPVSSSSTGSSSPGPSWSGFSGGRSGGAGGGGSWAAAAGGLAAGVAAPSSGGSSGGSSGSSSGGSSGGGSGGGW